MSKPQPPAPPGREWTTHELGDDEFVTQPSGEPPVQLWQRNQVEHRLSTVRKRPEWLLGAMFPKRDELMLPDWKVGAAALFGLGAGWVLGAATSCLLTYALLEGQHDWLWLWRWLWS